MISTQVAQRPAPPGTRGSTAVWYFAARGTGVWLGVGASTEVVGGADAAWREPLHFETTCVLLEMGIAYL